MKVKCPCVECQYNKNYKCKAGEINLKYRNMLTVNEGRVDMWIFDKYSYDEQTQTIYDGIKKIMEEGKQE